MANMISNWINYTNVVIIFVLWACFEVSGGCILEKAKMLYVLLNKFTPILNTYYDIDLGTFLGLKSF